MKLNRLRYYDESEKAKKYYLIVWVIIGIVAMIIISRLLTPSNQTDRYSAYAAARKFVEKTLKTPGSADFQSVNRAEITELGDNIWEINSYVDSKESSGTPVRTFFTIRIQYDGNEWILKRLSFEGKRNL
jgi:hypothetical protein